MTRWTAQRGSPEPEIHHLRPLTTISPVAGSFLMESLMFVASEEATKRSVIEKAERILPSSKGTSHFFFCSGVP